MCLITGLIMGLLIGPFLGLTLFACHVQREEKEDWLIKWGAGPKPTYQEYVREMIMANDPWYAWVILTLMFPGALLGHWLDTRKRTRLFELANQP